MHIFKKSMIEKKNRTNIDEQLHVFWDVVFGWILERFWVEVGGPKSLIFPLFRCFFGVIFEARCGRAKKCDKKTTKPQKAAESLRIPVVPWLLGRDYERGSQNIAAAD